jgi:hypothetical protein
MLAFNYCTKGRINFQRTSMPCVDIQVWIRTFKRIIGGIRWAPRRTQWEVVVLFPNGGSNNIYIYREIGNTRAMCIYTKGTFCGAPEQKLLQCKLVLPFSNCKVCMSLHHDQVDILPQATPPNYLNTQLQVHHTLFDSDQLARHHSHCNHDDRYSLWERRWHEG